MRWRMWWWLVERLERSLISFPANILTWFAMHVCFSITVLNLNSIDRFVFVFRSLRELLHLYQLTRTCSVCWTDNRKFWSNTQAYKIVGKKRDNISRVPGPTYTGSGYLCAGKSCKRCTIAWKNYKLPSNEGRRWARPTTGRPDMHTSFHIHRNTPLTFNFLNTRIRYRGPLLFLQIFWRMRMGNSMQSTKIILSPFRLLWSMH